MSQVGIWNGVDSGASKLGAGRANEENNYAWQSQRTNIAKAFGISATPSPGF